MPTEVNYRVRIRCTCDGCEKEGAVDQACSSVSEAAQVSRPADFYSELVFGKVITLCQACVEKCHLDIAGKKKIPLRDS